MTLKEAIKLVFNFLVKKYNLDPFSENSEDAGFKKRLNSLVNTFKAKEDSSGTNVIDLYNYVAKLHKEGKLDPELEVIGQDLQQIGSEVGTLADPPLKPKPFGS